MINELIYKYEKSCFIYDRSNVKLPEQMIKDINANWEELIADGKKCTNGELFTINNILMDSDGIIKFIVNKTNYAHYLYSKKKDFECDHVCCSIAANVLPVTTDNYYVLGVMANWTVLPNKIKFVGGSMSEHDFIENRLEPLKCVKREMMEEIGIDLDDIEYVKSYEPIYFVTRKNLSFINVLYLARLNLSSSQIKDRFEKYKTYLIDNDMEVELDSILLVKNDIESNREFINANRNNLIEYMESLFNVIYGIQEANNIIDKITCKNNKLDFSVES